MNKDIELLEGLIADQRTPADERVLYQKTLDKLKPTEPMPPAKRRATTPAPALQVVKGGGGAAAPAAQRADWYDHQGQPRQFSDEYIQHPDRDNVKIFVGPKRVPKVTIEGVSLTEGQVRGQLTTHLRDLVESKYANESRWHDLHGYKTYQNAQACVAGMVAFFGPSFRWEYLQVPNGSKLKRFIFSLLLADYWATATVVWSESEARRDSQYTETAQIGPFSATVWGDGNRGAQMTLFSPGRDGVNLAPIKVKYSDLAAAKVEARKLVVQYLQKSQQ